MPVRPRIWRFLALLPIRPRHREMNVITAPDTAFFWLLFRLCSRLRHKFFVSANFSLQSSAHFLVFSLFAEFRVFTGFVLFGQFWYFFDFSSFSKSCAHLLTFSENDHFDDRFSTFFGPQEAEKSSIFRHFYRKTELRPLRRRPRCGYEVEVTLCVRRNESQVRQS